MPKFLHAACGGDDKTRTTREFAKEEWQETRMDAYGEANPDVVSSLPDMLGASGLQTASFDAAFTSHSLERLYAHQAVAALENLARVLKDDGYLVVACSDLQAICALVAEDKLLEPAYQSPAGPVTPLDVLYGFRPALAAGHENHACKCGFTSHALMGSLRQAGFKSLWITKNPSSFSLVCIACKQEVPEEHLRELIAKHFG